MTKQKQRHVNKRSFIAWPLMLILGIMILMGVIVVAGTGAAMLTGDCDVNVRNDCTDRGYALMNGLLGEPDRTPYPSVKAWWDDRPGAK